jgi:hypothetical protein
VEGLERAVALVVGLEKEVELGKVVDWEVELVREGELAVGLGKEEV